MVLCTVVAVSTAALLQQAAAVVYTTDRLMPSVWWEYCNEKYLSFLSFKPPLCLHLQIKEKERISSNPHLYFYTVLSIIPFHFSAHFFLFYQCIMLQNFKILKRYSNIKNWQMIICNIKLNVLIELFEDREVYRCSFSKIKIY